MDLSTTTPQDLKKQAENAYGSKQYQKAAGLFKDAAAGYTAAGDILNAAEMASNRSVALLQAGDAKGALEAVQGVSRVFELAGDARRQAMALGNEAAALEATRQSKAAIEKYEQCAALLKQIGDLETRTLVMKNISQIQLRQGRQLEAMATMDAALNNRKKLNLIERLLKWLLKIPFKMLNRG